MAKTKILFSIGKLVQNPYTKQKETKLVTSYPHLVVNLINRYTEGFMYRQDGKAHFYIRDYNKLNHYLSIMVVLLKHKTFENEAELHKTVVKYYKRRSKYISVYKENTTKEQRAVDEVFHLLNQEDDHLKKELIHRGFVINTSNDKRYLEENWYVTCNGFNYPVSNPSKSKLKKLFYSKIRIKGLTKIRQHGY